MKPYRCEKYNNDDINYTEKIKKSYIDVSDSIKDKFDRYTENLMDDNIINKKELIKAIESFEINNVNSNLFLFEDWCIFTHIVENNNKSTCNIL